MARGGRVGIADEEALQVLVNEEEGAEYGDISPESAPEPLVQGSNAVLRVELSHKLGVGCHLGSVSLGSHLEELQRCAYEHTTSSV